MIYVGLDIYGNPAYLDDAAGQSYLRMRRDGCPEGITSALRTHAQQVALFTSRYRQQAVGSGPFGDVRYWNGVRYVRFSPAGSVAVPGSPTSRHEKGLSLDLPVEPRAWVRAHGESYGWIKDVVPSESWHMEFQQWRDAHYASNPGGGTPTVPTVPTVPGIPDIDPVTNLLNQLEDDMRLARKSSTGEIVLVGVATLFRLETQDEVNVMQGIIGKPAAELTDDQWNLLNGVINKSIVNTGRNLRLPGFPAPAA